MSARIEHDSEHNGFLVAHVRNDANLSDTHGKFVTRSLDELNPHPSYVRHHVTVSASQLTMLIEFGDHAFRDPLVITRNGTILDGYAQYELARLQGRITLQCIEYEMTENEGLHWILQRHRRSNRLSNFTRILLALELEPWLREKALSNQRAGGQNKGSSKVTEASRAQVRAGVPRPRVYAKET